MIKIIKGEMTMYKIGQHVLLKQGTKLVKCIIIDVDLTFITLKMEYKKGSGANIKVNVNSKNLINPEGANITGFDFNNDFFSA